MRIIDTLLKLFTVTAVQSSGPDLNWYIDQPSSWSGCRRFLIIKGWCFSSDGTPIRAIRAVFGEAVFSGAIGLSRPDVKSAFPAAPNEYTGFDVRAVVPRGQKFIRIEAQDGSFKWRLLFQSQISIRSRPVPLWLEFRSTPELLYFQFAAGPKHAPRPIAPEVFPTCKATDLPTPRLSIVTPSFQQAEFLKETVVSVIEQASLASEYIVQDGASSDGSSQILSKLMNAGDAHRQSTTRRVWSSAPDAGQADAILRGFAKTLGASGDLMAWINSDDYYLPGSLPYVIAFFQTHPEVDVIYGHRVLVDQRSREIGRWFLPPHDDEVLRLNDFVPQETLFWRRRIWDRVGGIDPSFKFAMDWDLLLRFQAAGAKIVRVPYFLACFRIHAAQKTSAQMESVGQKEIDALRLRTFGRVLSPTEIENNPRLIRYLRKSAWIEFLWRRFGIRHP
jgi:glycosyltransferase involved in cell wall biosynthesis